MSLACLLQAAPSGKGEGAAAAEPLLAAAADAQREKPLAAADLVANGVKEKATFGPKKFRPKR